MVFCPSEENNVGMVRRKYVNPMPKSGYKYPEYGDLRLTCFTAITYTFPFRWA